MNKLSSKNIERELTPKLQRACEAHNHTELNKLIKDNWNYINAIHVSASFPPLQKQEFNTNIYPTTSAGKLFRALNYAEDDYLNARTTAVNILYNFAKLKQIPLKSFRNCSTVS